MIFYKCLDCGEIFPENEMAYQKHIERHDEMTVETLSEGRCPKCKSEDLQEVQECLICGKGFDAKEGSTICPECEKAAFQFDPMLEYVASQPECNFESIKVNPIIKMLNENGIIDINAFAFRMVCNILIGKTATRGVYKHGIKDEATALLDDFVSADYSDYSDWYKEHYGKDKK